MQAVESPAPPTVREAAGLLGVSVDWVRRRLAEGTLESIGGRPARITIESLLETKKGLVARQTEPERPYLRLVVDNTRP